jgi:hypothetical protein
MDAFAGAVELTERLGAVEFPDLTGFCFAMRINQVFILEGKSIKIGKKYAIKSL